MPLIKVPKTVAKKTKTITRRKAAKPDVFDTADVQLIHGEFPPESVIQFARKFASRTPRPVAFNNVTVEGKSAKYLGQGVTCTAYKIDNQWVMKVLHEHGKWASSLKGIEAALTHVRKHVPSCLLVKGTKRTVMIQEFLTDEVNDIYEKVKRLGKKCTAFELHDIRGGNVGIDKKGNLKIMDFGSYNVNW